MKSYNKTFHKLFNEIADLMSIMGEGFFKTRAYREGARVLMEEAEPITKENASVEEFLKIHRIGKALANKMMEYIETGKIRYLEELRKEVPKSVVNLMKIPGLGAGRVGKLYFELGIDSKQMLKKFINNKGDLTQLRGFGKKLVTQIMSAIQSGQQKKKRHRREDVEPIAKKILSMLKKIKGVKKVEIAGSYRRENKMIGDLDILINVETRDLASLLINKISKSFPNITILGAGDTKISFVIFPENLQVDIRMIGDDSYGAALLYFTGSKNHNIKMRNIAIKKGLLLNEYGLFKEGEYMAGKTEKEIFKKLGMDYIKPDERK